jgi:hypothetical protein
VLNEIDKEIRLQIKKIPEEPLQKYGHEALTRLIKYEYMKIKI